MLLPPNFLQRCRQLKEDTFSGKVELHWKDGNLVGWTTFVSEKADHAEPTVRTGPRLASAKAGEGGR